MSENTAIEWCDSTINAWEGCSNISPGCKNCYAEAMNKWLHKGANWGPGAPRLKHGDAWKLTVRSWQRNAAKFAEARSGRIAGPRRLVFVNSTSDTFYNEVPDAWRTEVFDEIRAAPDVVFILVTKRIGNAQRMLPSDWGAGWKNVILLITVVNQDEADRDIAKLLALPAWCRGLSVEPMLGPVDLSPWLPIEHGRDGLWRRRSKWHEDTQLGWCIVGGESGPKARPMQKEWARSLAQQCKAAGIAFFMKQMGGSVGALKHRGSRPTADTIVIPYLKG